MLVHSPGEAVTSPSAPRTKNGLASSVADAMAATPSDAFASAAPSINLPKGGGAVRGLGEKFSANSVTGTGSMSVPIFTSPGRSGFGPSLSLSYDSGAGNGPFGLGWSLSLPSITRKTDKGLPQYLDDVESDVFMLSGAEDLVPAWRRDDEGSWVARHRDQGFRRDEEGFVRDAAGRLVVHEDEIAGHRVRRYLPRIEGLFARIECWQRIGVPADVHWRSVSRDNVLTIYGADVGSRIADPLVSTRIFAWLICESRDDRGNGIRYLYKAENGAVPPPSPDQRPSGHGAPFVRPHQANRGVPDARRRTAQRYLQRVLYGNRTPLLDAEGRRPLYLRDLPAPPSDTPDDWLFELRFDYGELDLDDPTGRPEGVWRYRDDAFSSYRAGFEVRTCRRCRQALMLHHVPDQPADDGRPARAGYRGVVHGTRFVYADERAPPPADGPVYSVLEQVVQTGWSQEGGTTVRRSLPPLRFHYTEPVVQDAVVDVAPEHLANLPIGVDGVAYRWVDLHGEGVPGVLTEQSGAWHYRRNLSPLANTAALAPLETVALKPNLALGGGAEIVDLAGDGRPDVVVMDGPQAGFHAHDEADGWAPFRPFASPVNRDLRDPNLRFVDLDGDGHADLLITEDEALVWHASLAADGFGPARRVAQALDEEHGPRCVFADGTQSLYLADLSGDGLTDLVRIRNGEVCYWPNLGYGRFGAKVTMDDSPWFDHPDQFSQARVRLADIDGTGTTDLIYLHRDGVRLYFNRSGNGWSAPRTLKVFPRIDELATIVPVDLLGNGTACLVWCSRLPGDAARPMRYVDLMGGRKPHLLVRVVNNLGAETRIDYAPSTRFYLRDRLDGRPWITRLPFPVQVVERVETLDHIGHSRFVTRYAYHHGCYDGDEREFRGFGMVEQWDTERIDAVAQVDAGERGYLDPAAPHTRPPVLTKTWFHTGTWIGPDTISRHFAGARPGRDGGEYFRAPGLDAAAAEALCLPDTVLPPGLDADEAREACRALKGAMLRQEVYALDGVGRTDRHPSGLPYTVTEQNFSVRRVQPRGGQRHAVFFTHPRESLASHHERRADDPRIQHALTLAVDAYGNVLREAAIAYGRRTAYPALPDDDDRDRQLRMHLTVTEHVVTRAIDEPGGVHRTPLPAETVTYEVRRAVQERSADLPAPRLSWEQVRDRANQAGDGTHEVVYEDGEFASAAARVAAGQARPDDCFRRPIERLRTRYRRDDLTGLLPLRESGAMALPGEQYKLAFTPGLLNRIYRRPRAGQADEDLLPADGRVQTLGGRGGDQGGYVDLDGDGHWWVPSGRSFFAADPASPPADELAQARRHFFLPVRYRDPFDVDAVVEFDAHDLLLMASRDALGNRVTVELADYRVLQPRRIRDPNGNRTEVAFDALGRVTGTAVMGKAAPAPQEGDTLEDFDADPSDDQVRTFLDAPRRASANPSRSEPATAAHRLLAGASTRIVYDLDRFLRSGEPPCVATIARETHVSDLAKHQTSRLQIALAYSDGFGREIQRKIQAEPGPVPTRDARGRILLDADGRPAMTATTTSPRWVGSSWTIHDNKGAPVRQYEPFFSDTHRFEFGVAVGVSAVVFRDPVGRVIATLHPNHTYEKVVFDPWRQTTWDVNDTCAPRGDQTGDPRSDPDIGGLVAAYFATQPAGWTTWHARRITGALGAEEQRAAELAAAHADTPSTAHFDSLGRPFLTVARNRVICKDHPLDGRADEDVRSRVDLDIEGNTRAVRDERRLPDDQDRPFGALEQRIVMRYDHDMLGQRLHQLSMEAGPRWVLNDVTGKVIRAWDGRGHCVRTHYDALRRPIGRHVRGVALDAAGPGQGPDPRTIAAEVLVERIEYGEPPVQAPPEREADAQRLNLRTRVLRHYDSAGLVIHAALADDGGLRDAYDFEGRPICSTRRLASDPRALPDWSGPDETQLDAESFEARTRHDALGRAVQSVAPRSSLGRGKFHVVQPMFNEANLLERIDTWLERDSAPTELLDPAKEPPSEVGVAGIDYDAKGQRSRIDYKNGASTVYTHDPLTFRLTRLVTRRDPVQFPGDDPPARDEAWPGRLLQNLHYTYDPAGNIVRIRDDAQQTIHFRNVRVEPSNAYVYDALYRLIEATGRERLARDRAPIPHSYNDAGRVAIVSVDAFGRYAPNDGAAMGEYTERYVYDAVGNFLQMQHRTRDAAHPGWTRRYAYGEASLIEPGKVGNRLSRTRVGNGIDRPVERYTHDAHGNMLDMPHLHAMRWDWADRLLMTQRQKVDDDDADGAARQGERTWYTYDASGERVRKVTELAGSGAIKDERIYIGAFELYRRHRGAFESRNVSFEALHLDFAVDAHRFATVNICTLDAEADGRSAKREARYIISNHLGSSTHLLDERGEVTSYEEYSSYGSSTFQSVRSRLEYRNRFRSTGKERDDESGFYYHGARYYCSLLGRWVAADPLDIIEGSCCYRYVLCNPVRLVDPKGHSSAPPGALGHRAPYIQQINPRRLFGQIVTEAEHVIPRGVLKALTYNPLTKKSDYSLSRYLKDETVIVERETALAKTFASRGIASADNARTAAAKTLVESAAQVGTHEGVDLTTEVISALKTTHKARAATESIVSIEQVNTAVLGQLGNLFETQRLGDTAKAISEFHQTELAAKAATATKGAGVASRLGSATAVVALVLVAKEAKAEVSARPKSDSVVDKIDARTKDLEHAVDLGSAAMSVHPTGGGVTLVATGLTLAAEEGIKRTGGDDRIVKVAESVEKFASKHGASSDNSKVLGALGAGFAGMVEGGRVIGELTSGPIGLASLGSRLWASSGK